MNSGEDSAFPIISSSSSALHEFEGSVSMSPDSSWKIIAVVLTLGGDDMEVDEQDRELVDSERESGGARERERKNTKQGNNKRSNI